MKNTDRKNLQFFLRHTNCLFGVRSESVKYEPMFYTLLSMWIVTAMFVFIYFIISEDLFLQRIGLTVLLLSNVISVAGFQKKRKLLEEQKQEASILGTLYTYLSFWPVMLGVELIILPKEYDNATTIEIILCFIGEALLVVIISVFIIKYNIKQNKYEKCQNKLQIGSSIAVGMTILLIAKISSQIIGKNVTAAGIFGILVAIITTVPTECVMKLYYARKYNMEKDLPKGF